MPKYLDGVQAIEQNITFKTVASGTITVTANQYPKTNVINQQNDVKTNYVLLINNKSGQNIASIGTNTITNFVPNSLGLTFGLLSGGASPATIANNSRGSLEITTETPNPFAGGQGCEFQFNLAAAGTGTIDWALIGY